MNIQSTSRALAQGSSSRISPEKKAKLDKDLKIAPDATVTYDQEKDCFSFVSAGTHRSLCRHSALGEGLKMGAIAAIPAALGAFQGELIATTSGALVGTVGSALAGAALGGTALAYSHHKESSGHPLYTAWGAVLGAFGGGLGTAVLMQGGLHGGVAGAAATVAIIGGGAALFQAHQNHKATQAALAHGWQA